MKLSPEERKERIKEYQREYYERNRGDRPRRILFSNLTEEERKEKRMRSCFNWFPFWLIYENIIYTINRFVLQKCGDRVGIVRILLGGIFGGCLF